MAAPNPEKELNRLHATLKKGLPPVVLISGESAFFRGEAMDAVVAALPGDVDVRSVSGNEDTSGDELQDLRGGSLFGSGSYLVVRRGEGWLKQHGEAILAMLPGIAASCGLVLEVAKLDKRTKLGKALAKHAAFEFRRLYDEPYDRSRSPLEAETVGWIAARGKKKGVPLTREAAYLVMTSVGSDPAECVAELERLAVQHGGAKRALRPEDLRGALSCSFESDPFELAEAMLDRDRKRAERSLAAMYGRGVRSRSGDSIDRGGLFPFITSWLYKALAQAYEGRFLMQQGVPLQQVPKVLGVRVFVDRFVRQLDCNTEPGLRRGLELLHEAQRELRETGEDAEWILTRMMQRYFAEAAS